MSNLTLDQAIGQLFMVGLPGPKLNPGFADLIRKWSIGNVVLFARNLTDGGQAQELTSDLQRLITEATGLPALISADQEGGIVLRLVEGATPFPGNMAVGATHNPAYARDIAHAIGKELLSLGININLAPVLDINNNPRNPVIGVRSFGSTVEQVTQFGRAAVAGYRQAGILCVAKHFPGHGDTEVDSHTSLPTIDRSLTELRERELVPFAAAVDAGLDAIMTAHILFPQLDSVPATLSHPILTVLLREEMGFQGLIITDSMRMAGITHGYGPGEAAVEALKAGCDILLYSAMGEVEEQGIAAVHEAVRRGELSEERIYASAQRIVTMKERLGRVGQVDFTTHRELALEVSQRAVTLVRDEDRLLPVSDESLTVIEVTRRAITQVEEQLTLSGLRTQMSSYLPGAQHLTVGTNPDAETVDRLCEEIEGETVVLVSQDAWRNPGQEELMRRLVRKHPRRVILVAGRLPYDVDLEPSIGTALCTYDLVPTTIQALLDVLTGTIQPVGRLP